MSESAPKYGVTEDMGRPAARAPGELRVELAKVKAQARRDRRFMQQAFVAVIERLLELGGHDEVLVSALADAGRLQVSEDLPRAPSLEGRSTEDGFCREADRLGSVEKWVSDLELAFSKHRTFVNRTLVAVIERLLGKEGNSEALAKALAVLQVPLDCGTMADALARRLAAAEKTCRKLEKRIEDAEIEHAAHKAANAASFGTVLEQLGRLESRLKRMESVPVATCCESVDQPACRLADIFSDSSVKDAMEGRR